MSSQFSVMDLRIIFLFSLLFVLGNAQDGKKGKKSVRGKIVGGKSVYIDHVKYTVSVSHRDKGHFCGGSAITPYHVLTAAHCVDGLTSPELFVRTGSTEVNKGGVTTKVAKTYSHANYNERTVSHDIAILRLATPIKDVQVIPLAINEPAVGSWGLVTGWGLTDEEGVAASRNLQQVFLPIISRESCRQKYAKMNDITENMLCAGYDAGGKDACQGDSGGPIVVDGVQVGIVSWGKGCARAGTPGVFTSIPKYKDWIQKVVALG